MAAEIQEKQAAREIDAPYCPFTATVTAAAVLWVNMDMPEDAEDRVVVHQFTQLDGSVGGKVSHSALRVISQALDYTARYSPNFDPEIHSVRACSIFGLKIKDRLQLMAADALRYCADSGTYCDIPPELWSHPNFKSAIWCDPYDVIVPSDQRQWVKYDQLAAYLKINVDLAAVETDALKQAQFAMALAKAANL